ncbi:TapB family protein [Hymenobacter psychrophilus]|uniref:DUF3108 domain-containing protein n=1 Tax=Hymenobacter psychrophilus TaxID=651662 RepID=A0A1H3CU84_9BACT|nr:hypothetical protein [Hymenobacter psychrophilus]SDX56979.1 hypothetical protein SAMN04488069_10294 [Hymenobacter psychrophilus]
MSPTYFVSLVTGLLASAALQAQTLPAGPAPAATPAANCPHPFGLADNMARHFTLQDGRGKTTGFVHQRVVSLGTEQNKKKTQTTNTALLKSGTYDAKGRLLYLRDLTFRCRQDTAFTDGLDQLNPAQLSSFRDRLLTYSPSPLPWPNQPAVGSELPSGGIMVDVRSSAVDIAKVYATVSKRRVTGQETVTTPAGTFACYKVEAELETATVARADLKLASTMRVVDYYAPAVGLVKSEMYDKKGRLEQVRLLTGLDQSAGAVTKETSKRKKL